MAARVVDADVVTWGDVDITRILSYVEPVRIDLKLPVMTVEYYRVFPEPPVSEELFADIRANGIREPLCIYTNGVKAVLRDGHHRLYVARMCEFDHVPVHVVPNWLERVYVGYGLPDVEKLLSGWLADNVEFTHEHHIQKRIQCNRRLIQVSCSCGARWREVGKLEGQP